MIVGKSETNGAVLNALNSQDFVVCTRISDEAAYSSFVRTRVL